MSSRKADPFPLLIAGSAIAFAVVVCVVVVRWPKGDPGAGSSADTETLARAAAPAAEPVPMGYPLESEVPYPKPDDSLTPEVVPSDEFPEVEPVEGANESFGGDSTPFPGGAVPFGGDASPESLQLVPGFYGEPSIPAVTPAPKPLDPEERFVDVPGSGFEENWDEEEAGIPVAARRHLERAEEAVRATPTRAKTELASLAAERASKLRFVGDSRQKAAINNQYDKQAKPLEREIRRESIASLADPQPLRRGEPRVGAVGSLVGATVVEIVDDATLFVDLPAVPPAAGAEPPADGAYGPTTFARGEDVYVPGQEGGYVPGQDAGADATGGVHVRGLPTGAFRVTGLVEDRARPSGPAPLGELPPGTRVFVLSPYDRYDEVAAFAEEYGKGIRE